MVKKIIFHIVFLIFSLGFSQSKMDDSSIVEDKIYKAISQRAIGNYDKAIDLLNECAEKSNDYSIYFELAKNYYDTRNFTLAENNCKKALLASSEKNSNWINKLLAKIYVATKNYNSAIEILNKMPKSDLNSKIDLAKLHLILDDTSLSKSILIEIRNKGFSNRLSDSLSNVLGFNKNMNTNKAANSNQNFDSLLNIYEKEKKIESYLNLIEFLEENDSYSKINEMSIEAKDIFPFQPIVHLLSAKANIIQNKLSDAEGDLNNVKDFLFEGNSLLGEYWVLKSQIFKLKNNQVELNKSINEIDLILKKIQPENKDYFYLNAIKMSLLDKIEDAEKFWMKAIEKGYNKKIGLKMIERLK